MKGLKMHELNKTTKPANREGFAMVTTLLMVLVLSVMAVGVVWIATSEKKTVFAESVHVQSLFSADAGSEAGINFIRVSDSPPQIQDFNNMTVRSVGETGIAGSQTYDYSCQYVTKRPRPGWGVEYLDYDYQVMSHGTASRNGESGVQVVVSRLFREGY